MKTLFDKVELALNVAILVLLIAGFIILAVMAVNTGARATAETTAETPAEIEAEPAETDGDFQPDMFYNWKYDGGGRIYALATKIVELDWERDIVVCEDCNGFLWEFIGIEDWEIGDCASLVMYTNDTDLIYDDVIIRATYSTWELSK